MTLRSQWDELMKDASIFEAQAEAFQMGGAKQVAQTVRPLKRKNSRYVKKEMIAYDLETTRIKNGTPRVKYITAYGRDGSFKISDAINGSDDLEILYGILADKFLVTENKNVRFVAWNGNGFDAFFIARAILTSDRWTIRPYLTRSKSLRGFKVLENAPEKEPKNRLAFEFLDGMAMTGLDTVKMPLKKFLSLFAPDYLKKDLDFSKEEFDASNPLHVEYAERDAEGLWHAMQKVDGIARELTGIGMQPTMGNLAIKYFQSQLPEDVLSWKAPKDVHAILSTTAKRGGYCWIARQFHGPVWKYDLNQAYAAAMRDCALPSGSCTHTSHFAEGEPGLYRVTISRKRPSPIPFYYRALETQHGLFTAGAKVETWLLSTEIEHLWADDWDVEIHDGYYWNESFNMREMVDNLERLRFSDPQGPSGPLGTMVKTLGNSAYGKTLEKLDGLELVMAKECPDGFLPMFSDEDECLPLIWQKDGEIYEKPYHRPQIGCFITAHVRLLVRSAALGSPKEFLYADTDCVVFSAPVSYLDIDPRRYGAWKLETAGKVYSLIGKKIYCDEKGEEKRGKGLHIRELTRDDFDKWMNGQPPTQKQTQRQNFVKFLSGAEMFRDLERRGTDVHKSKQAILVDGFFNPA